MTQPPSAPNSLAEKILLLLRINEEMQWAKYFSKDPVERRRPPANRVPRDFRHLELAAADIENVAILRRFVSIFDRELRVVQQARNEAVHGFDLDEETVDEALAVATELQRILHKQTRTTSASTEAVRVGQAGLSVQALQALLATARAHNWDAQLIQRLTDEHFAAHAEGRRNSSERSTDSATIAYWERLAAATNQTT